MKNKSWPTKLTTLVIRNLTFVMILFGLLASANSLQAEKCKNCDDHGFVHQTVSRPCNYCKQTGFYTMKVLVDHECAACKGYGQVFIYPRDKKDDSSNRLLVTCRACSGRGYNTIREPHKMTCPNCDGRGFNLKKHWKTCQRCFGQKDPAPHNQIAPEMAK